MIAFTSDQWVIIALVFVLGLLVGAFLFAGSGRKWKQRYRAETERREAIEREHAERNRDWETREKEWREQDSLRSAAIKDRRDEPTDRPL
jgi:Flp pilus assembly protein TadB